jgi:hypothetical protein
MFPFGARFAIGSIIRCHPFVDKTARIQKLSKKNPVSLSANSGTPRFERFAYFAVSISEEKGITPLTELRRPAAQSATAEEYRAPYDHESPSRTLGNGR